MSRARSQEMRIALSVCALLLLSNQPLQQVYAQDGQSLIESALDGNYTAPETTTPPSAQPEAVKEAAKKAPIVKVHKAKGKTKESKEVGRQLAEEESGIDTGASLIRQSPAPAAARGSAPAPRSATSPRPATAPRSAPPAPGSFIAPRPVSAAASSTESSTASGDLRGSDLLRSNTGASSAVHEPAWTESNYPEPKEITTPPIHSKLPASTPKMLGVPLGVKVGKSFPIDMTYRGKPALPQTQTVSVGSAPWAIPQKKQIAASPAAVPVSAPVAPATAIPVAPPAVIAPQATLGPDGKPVEPKSTINIRFKTLQKLRYTDSIWAYPYPPKPPKQVVHNPLSEDGPDLKNRILQHGYTYRPDLTRPYPSGGWRWVLAFDNGLKKAGCGYPHTMITMYPWVNKVLPYILSETRQFNLVEAERSKNYERVLADYERVHTDIEAQATAKGLQPIEIKVSPRGIAQQPLPAGNWWIAATRKSPGLKFYWQVPISCSGTDTLSVELTETNALIIAGGW